MNVRPVGGTGGWRATCRCGFDSGLKPTFDAATQALMEHRADVRDDDTEKWAQKLWIGKCDCGWSAGPDGDYDWLSDVLGDHATRSHSKNKRGLARSVDRGAADHDVGVRAALARATGVLGDVDDVDPLANTALWQAAVQAALHGR